MPIGISIGAISVLANKSQITKNSPPAMTDEGINTLWSEPIASRIIWGIISPTNPISPQVETIAAVSSEDRTNSIFLTLSIFIPKWIALSSPSVIMFKSRQNNKLVAAQMATIIPVDITNLTSNTCRFPNSHQIILCSPSLGEIETININILEKTEPTITPDKRSA